MSLGTAFERRNPALTATGLAVWGLTIRVVIAVSIFFVPKIVDTVTPLVEKSPVVQAVLADPTPVGSTTVGKVATAASENPTVTAKLAEVQQRDGPLLVALQKNPAVAAALAKAQAAGATHDQLAQIRQALGPAAFAILVKPQTPADLTYLQTTAPKALGPAEFAAISAPNPALQKGLATLQADGPEVQAAAADSPRQWRTQFLIGAAGQVVFIPLIFLMAGYRDPRKAKAAEEAHEALVEREMAKLGTPAEPATA